MWDEIGIATGLLSLVLFISSSFMRMSTCHKSLAEMAFCRIKDLSWFNDKIFHPESMKI